MSLSIAFAITAATLAGSYDCALQRRAVVNETAVQAGDTVNFPQAERDSWRFGVRTRDGRDGTHEVEVRWPEDLIQIGGTHPALDIAPGHLAFVAIAQGPCMFTERACMSLVQLSAREDGSAFVTIMPAGLSGNEREGRTQLHMIFTGTCRRQNGS